tara:strand:- start:154 stop:351 length:198 start_codon:yes stop_codon:yes gene_type:complete
LSSAKDNERAVVTSFLISDEFKESSGSNISNAQYVEIRYAIPLGLVESAKNKALLSGVTGLSYIN